MFERPLLLPLAALMSGIGATTLSGYAISPWVILPSGLLFVSGLIFKRTAYTVLAVSLAALYWGGFSAEPFIKPALPSDNVVRHITDSPSTVTGVLYQRPDKRDTSTRLYLDIDSFNGVKASGRALITVKAGPVPCMTGDLVSLSVKLCTPRNFGIPGEYDFSRALALKGIHVTGYLPDAADLIILREKTRFCFQRKIDDTASWFSRFIDSSVKPSESGVLKALLVGDRGGVPQSIEQLYARTGVNHILSISGFHVGIIAIVVYQLLSFIARRFEPLLYYNLRWKLMLATLPLLVWYLLVSGSAPATIRSVLMISACFIALLLERESDPVNVLALAALVILAVSPGALFDISFQLSFTALWGILVITPSLLSFYNRPRKGPAFMAVQFCAVSTAAIVATMFPVAYTFHRVSLVGLISNFIVVPLLGYGAVVCGFTALIISTLLPVPAALLLKVAAHLVIWSNSSMAWLDRIPQLPRFSPTLLEVAISIALLLIFTIIRVRWKKLAATALLIAIACSFRFFSAVADKGTMYVYFMSVGQGDSTFIRFTDGSTMLVDGGGSLQEGGYDVGERLLAPALWTLGADRIDRLVLSHPHPDHVKGLLFVARNFPVGEFWVSGYESGFPPYGELKELLSGYGVPLRIVNSATQPFSAGGALIEPLSPPPAPKVDEAINSAVPDANEESMVFRISSGRFSILFTGDAGFETESRLLKNPQGLKSTVLKVAHHGSRYSSSLPFLKAVSPRLSLISAGYGNNFGLPAPETVADISKIGSEIHRTDLEGTVEIAVTPSTGGFRYRKYNALPIDTY